MSNYPLTLGADNIIGSDAADVFDGYNDDDGAGLTGGTDLLSGLAGNDTFLVDSEYSLVNGTIDGGADMDTVIAYGFDLGSLEFQNVEVLIVNTYDFSLSISQANAFSSIRATFLVCWSFGSI